MLEINISCPNVKEGGIAFGQDPKAVEAITKAVKAKAKQPVIMKLSPNVTDITVMAKAAEAGGADAISLINTLTGMKIDINRQCFALANKTGGLSGLAIKPIAVRMVYQAANAVSIPVIGMGGIACAEDALEFILAGASAVSIGTANFFNPYALAGIAVHALAQTLLMLLKLTADPEKELASIEYWIMGSLAAVTRSRVWFPVPVVLVCCAAIFALHRQALLLSIEEGEARLLGVRVGAMRLLLLTLATMTVAAVVSVTGLISFVGLLAPHSARLLAGHNRRSACLLSGLLGSALLLAADTLAKTAASTELPVSIFTSLLGVPFLLYLILRPGRDAS